MHGKTQKTQCLCGIVREASFIYASVSSQARYDHFDTLPYAIVRSARLPDAICIIADFPSFVNPLLLEFWDFSALFAEMLTIQLLWCIMT